MPELAEVEAFKHYIAHHCLEKEIVGVSMPDGRVIKKITAAQFKKDLVGQKFTRIERAGKYLILSASSGQKLVMHFGLTGFPVWATSGQAVRFACVIFDFADKKSLYYADVRKFGKIWLVPSIDKVPGLRDLGVDSLKISQVQWLALLEKNARKNVKAFLMNQSVIAGIGNEYSDEILFQSGIDPHHAIKDLPLTKRKSMYKKMRTVLTYALKVRIGQMKQLSTQKFFSAEEGRDFKSSYLQAHRHTDMRCPHNSTHKLKKATIAGRSSYYCPIDQK